MPPDTTNVTRQARWRAAKKDAGRGRITAWVSPEARRRLGDAAVQCGLSQDDVLDALLRRLDLSSTGLVDQVIEKEGGKK